MKFRVLALASLLSASLPIMAATYSYTGSDFTYSSVNNVPQNPPGTVAAPYSTSDAVNGSFSVAGNVGNLSFAPVTFTSFSFNDGVQTLNNSNASIFGDIATDANGNITEYAIGVFSSTVANDFIQIGDLGSPGGFGKFQELNGTVVSAGTNAFGSIAPTPEPSSLALLGTGMVGVVGGLRRRFRRA